MNLEKISVTLVGSGIIILICWFFFGKKPSFAKATEGQGVIDVLVDGGYKPEIIKLKKGKETVLKITRKDENSCLEDIVLPDFRIKKYLPLNQPVEIKIRPGKTGTFIFHCGMNMYHGKIIVE